MSQAGVINLAGGGGGGSPIMTLTGDSGGAVPPTANNINILGADSNVNNDNGITVIGTIGTSTLNPTLTNRANVTTSTVGAVTSTVVLFTPVNAKAVSFRALVVGYDTAGNAAVGGEQIGLVRKSAGTVVVVGTNDTFDESDAALAAADWNIVSASPDLSITFTGVAGKTIDWKVLFEYQQAP